MNKLHVRLTSARAALAGLAQRRSVRWSVYGLSGFLALLGLLGFLILPPLLKGVVEEQLSTALKRPASVERVEINPYALSLRLTGVSVTGGQGRQLLAFDELLVNVSAMSLFHRGLVVDELRLTRPRLHLVREAEGRYDISDLLAVWLKPSDAPPPRFSLNNLQLSGGEIVFDDLPVGRQHRVEGLAFRLPFVSNLPYQTEIFVEPSFDAIIDGARVALHGKSKPFAGSKESELELSLQGIDLAALQPYLPASVPLAIASARFDSDLKLHFSQQQGRPALMLSGGLQLTGLRLNEREGAPLLGWQKLDLRLADVEPLARRFHFERLTLQGIEVHAGVDRRGDLNWLRVLERLSAGQGKSAEQPAAKAETPAAPEIQLKTLLFEGGRVHWRDQSGDKGQSAELRDLRIVASDLDGSLKKPLKVGEISWAFDAGDALRLDRVEIRNSQLDPDARRLAVGEFKLRGGQLKAVRQADGRIDWLAAPRLRERASGSKTAGTADKPWQVALEKLDLDGLRGSFEDRSLSPSALQTLDQLSLNAEKIDTAAARFGTFRLQASVNKRGGLKAEGRLQLQPLIAEAKFEAKALPLLLLQPYFADRLKITLTRGNLSGKGEVALKGEAAGLTGSFKGQAAVNDLYTVDKANSADFLRWKSLFVGGIDVRLQPLNIAVNEISLTDFYSRLIVSPEGRLNLLDIAAGDSAPLAGEPREQGAGSVGTGKPAEKAAEAAGAKTPPQAAKPAEKAPIPLRIGKVTLQGGNVNFTDRYVKPNYTVNLTKVGGRISGLSSAADTVADMELRGAYANSAPVQITAKLNPLAAKAFLDLNAEVRGVDLVSLSPYSGKYAGYNIEKGKLSLFVSYKLKDNKLEAENRVFLDQLTFGDKVESASATSLPVNLAVALLKNRKGEIDVNLPISGSLDDPQFSLGGVIVKVIVNLFVKAVTSPFALIGSMFGGGEELSQLEFEAGSSRLPSDIAKRLDPLAKAMQDRPALKLEITGRVDAETDREGIKRVALERAVRSEKLKEMVAKGQEAGSLREVVVSAAEYPRYLQRAYRATKFPKPRNLIGLEKDLPVEEMEKLMLTHIEAGEEEMRLLAVRRAEAVQSWLSGQGKVEHERLFIMAPKFKQDEKDKKAGNRVDFSLR